MLLPHNSPEFERMNELEKRQYYDRVFQSLDSLQQEFLMSHATDVISSSSRSGMIHHPLPFFSVVVSLLRLLVLITLGYLSNPLGPITDLSNQLYAALAYTTIYLALNILQILLVIRRLCGFDTMNQTICQKYAEGYTMTSWANFKMFKNQQRTILASRAVLSSKLDERFKCTGESIELDFSLDVAKSILLMSSIVYERDHDSVKRAFNHPEDALHSLLRSEAKMLAAAKDWGCHFTSIADFQTAEGPFVGAFYDYSARPSPFMVIVFKGTSPQAMSEWIVDATLNLECCSDKLGAGFAHQGFYTSLFPGPSSQSQPSPYLRIIETINKVAKCAYEKTGARMNLFVGGHSLGAGMATLFYARLLESPEDLGPNTILRDAYCFGTPRACDSALASRFEYNLSKPVNFRRSLWRIVNRASSGNIGDIVTHVPPGLADRRETRSLFREASFLSYAAVGLPIDLLPGGEPPFYKFNSIPCGCHLNLLQNLKKAGPSVGPPKMSTDSCSSGSLRSSFDPIFWFNFWLKILAPCLHDHFPGSYYDSLEKISRYKPDR